METFVDPKEMVKDDHFSEKRTHALKGLHMPDIDPPIRDIIGGLKGIRHCFTLQSCHGHIIEPTGEGDRVERIEPDMSALPDRALYQLAYLALVLEDSETGRELYRGLEAIARFDRDFMQFGSAGWFWDDRGFRNSYVIQVEPARFRHLDRFEMDRGEARHWIRAREKFFGELRNRLGLPKSGP